MTTVLITLDETDAAHHAALTATNLFGPDAEYLAVHAAAPGPGEIVQVWGPLFGYDYPTVPAARLHDEKSRHEAVDEARLIAAQQAGALGVDAKPVGEVGDPAVVIRRVAEDRHVDVVVVGDHQRSWIRRLFDGSVVDDLLRSAGVPILVVPLPDDW